MENEITAHRAGKVTELAVTEGGSVAAGDTIARSIASGGDVSCPGEVPARGAPSCRCRPTSCRSAATATGASAGATWGRSATSSCCARPASRWAARPDLLGDLGPRLSAGSGSGHATLMPGARGEVWTEGREGDGLVLHSADEGSVVRIEAKHPEAGEVRAFLRFGTAKWVEAVCPTADGEYVWTRKRVDVPVECDVRIGERRSQTEARGVEDESAGYHPHHTVWSWSAGVGKATDGRSVGWNLVSGINDPPERSERAHLGRRRADRARAGRASTDSRRSRFDDGSRLDFAGECERQREENRFGVRYTYRQPFGSFLRHAPGGLELDARPRRDGAPRRPLVAPAATTRGTRSPPSTATAAPQRAGSRSGPVRRASRAAPGPGSRCRAAASPRSARRPRRTPRRTARSQPMPGR